jgi:hypothetical protein
MPYQFIEVIPQRVIMIKLIGAVSEEDIIEFNKSLVNAVTSVEDGQQIYVILDSLEVQSFPVKFNTLFPESSKILIRNPKIGRSVVLINNQLFGYFVSVISKMMSLELHQKNTIEEALTLLQQLDPTLNFDSYSI